MDNEWKVISRVQLIRLPANKTNDLVTITVMKTDSNSYSSFSSSLLDLCDYFCVLSEGYLNGKEGLIKVESGNRVFHKGNMIFEIASSQRVFTK